MLAFFSRSDSETTDEQCIPESPSEGAAGEDSALDTTEGMEDCISDKESKECLILDAVRESSTESDKTVLSASRDLPTG